ncbi:MAG: aminotransferase class I/II-fold pyridoxal phosphate-dependent enzyme [Planctomycetota bacterium]
MLIGQLRALKFKVAKSSANFVLAESKNCDAKEIYEKLTRQNIFIRYFDLPSLSNKLRITVGTSEQNDKLVLTLKEILSGKGTSHGR